MKGSNCRGCVHWDRGRTFPTNLTYLNLEQPSESHNNLPNYSDPDFRPPRPINCTRTTPKSSTQIHRDILLWDGLTEIESPHLILRFRLARSRHTRPSTDTPPRPEPPIRFRAINRWKSIVTHSPTGNHQQTVAVEQSSTRRYYHDRFHPQSTISTQWVWPGKMGSLRVNEFRSSAERRQVFQTWFVSTSEKEELCISHAPGLIIFLHRFCNPRAFHRESLQLGDDPNIVD